MTIRLRPEDAPQTGPPPRPQESRALTPATGSSVATTVRAASVDAAVAACLAELQALTGRDGGPAVQRDGGDPSPTSAGATAGTDGADALMAAAVATVRRLEELKCAAAAAQATLAVRLDGVTRSREARAGVPAERRGRGVAHELALARRVSPHAGRRLLGLAKILSTELPHTWETFRAGRITENAAIWIAQETSCLPIEHRLEVDRLLAADAARLEGMSEKQIRREAAKQAARLDPASVARRRSQAASSRHVSVTPAPDGMSRLTITVPLHQGVAGYAALKQHADAVHGTAASGGRGRGALMADAAICRLTGQEAADRVPVRINLVMTDQTLFGASTASSTPASATGASSTGTNADAGLGTGGAGVGAEEPTARIVERGVGSFDMPAELARRLAHAASQTAGGGTSSGVRPVAWVRRLYAHPTSGQLVAMDSRSRHVPAGLGDFISLRDQTCRTRYCDAPVRHYDHVTPVAEGGATTALNLQGLCEACNHAKQAPGWAQVSHTGPDGRHHVDTRTPASQRFRTTSPPAA